MERNQRARLLDAAAAVASQRGYAGLTVQHVIDRSGVSRSTFYQAFTNKQEVVLAAYDQCFARLLSTIEAACASQPEWPSKVRESIAAALRLAAAEPAMAALICVHADAAGKEGAQRVLDSRQRLAALLAKGRPATARLPEVTERTLVGAIWTMVAAELMAGQAERLPELGPQLAELTLLPYLGPEEAGRRSR